MKRKPISNKKSKKLFHKTAKKTHPKNNGPAFVMRGGIRL